MKVWWKKREVDLKSKPWQYSFKELHCKKKICKGVDKQDVIAEMLGKQTDEAVFWSGEN